MISWRKTSALTLVTLSLSLTACSDFFKSRSDSNSPKGPAPQAGGSQKPTGPLPEIFNNPNAGAFTEEKMLVNLGVNVMGRAAENFAAQIPVLKNSIRQYCEALTAGASGRREETQVKQDWQRAMLAFHEMDAAPFGPLMDNGRVLNDSIYAWPYLNACGIDNKVFDNARTAITIDGVAFNQKGLGAIEYLLFEDTLTSSCNPRSNRHMADWVARPDLLKKTDRCVWAQKLVEDLDAKAQELKTQWEVKDHNFTLTMINGSRFASLKTAINALTDSMSHIEQLKDAKLGRPLARHKDCSSEKCPEDVEHKFSGLSLASAEAHLTGFKALFTGSFSAAQTEHFGFDDLLAQAGRKDVADKILAALDRAILSVKNAQDHGSLKEQIEGMDTKACKASTMTDRQVEICAVHADVRDVAFIFKTEVLAALALKAPPTHQGDND